MMIKTDAIISDCGKYRYRLLRIWDNMKPLVMFCMLNPSTADHEKDDRTVTRCINFAKSWGYGGMYVGNLFAYRSTEPKELYNASDPFGSDNYAHLKMMADSCELVVMAYGNSKIVKDLIEKKGLKPLSAITGPIRYIELSNDGTPKHPLYLKGDLGLKSFV